MPLKYSRMLREVSRSPSYTEILPLSERLVEGEPAFRKAVNGFSNWAPSEENESDQYARYWGGVRTILETAARDWRAFQWLGLTDQVDNWLQMHQKTDSELKAAGGKIKFAQNMAAELQKIIPQHMGRIFNFDLTKSDWLNPTRKEINVVGFVARHKDFLRRNNPLNQALRAYFQSRLSAGTPEQARKAFWENYKKINGMEARLKALEGFLIKDGVGLRAPSAMKGKVFSKEKGLDQRLWGHWNDTLRHLRKLRISQAAAERSLDSLLDNFEGSQYLSEGDIHDKLSHISTWLVKHKEVVLTEQLALYAVIEGHVDSARRIFRERTGGKQGATGAERDRPNAKDVVISLETDPMEILHLGWPELGGSCLDIVNGKYQESAAGYLLNPAVGVIYVRDPQKPEQPLARVSVALDPQDKTLFVLSPIETSDNYEFAPIFGEYLKAWADQEGYVIVASEKLKYAETLGDGFVKGEKEVTLLRGLLPLNSDLTETNTGWKGRVRGIIYSPAAPSEKKAAKAENLVLPAEQSTPEVMGFKEFLGRGVLEKEIKDQFEEINKQVGWEAAYQAYLDFQRALDKDEVLFAVDSNNRLLGYLVMDSAGWIPFMAVLPDRQGSGIGGRLFEAAMDKAKAKKIAQIGLNYRENRPQASFYKNQGLRYKILADTPDGNYTNGDPKKKIIFEVPGATSRSADMSVVLLAVLASLAVFLPGLNGDAGYLDAINRQFSNAGIFPFTGSWLAKFSLWSTLLTMLAYRAEGFFSPKNNNVTGAVTFALDLEQTGEAKLLSRGVSVDARFQTPIFLKALNRAMLRFFRLDPVEVHSWGLRETLPEFGVKEEHMGSFQFFLNLLFFRFAHLESSAVHLPTWLIRHYLKTGDGVSFTGIRGATADLLMTVIIVTIGWQRRLEAKLAARSGNPRAYWENQIYAYSRSGNPGLREAAGILFKEVVQDFSTVQTTSEFLFHSYTALLIQNAGTLTPNQISARLELLQALRVSGFDTLKVMNAAKRSFLLPLPHSRGGIRVIENQLSQQGLVFERKPSIRPLRRIQSFMYSV
ncbi:MAG: GNAT family N-acetyltransferase [Candidatus Firestonebacteria bacterium]|nr:GNAT family N-acetyltransferase [Candidatus Firestonebacteria bacterium]